MKLRHIGDVTIPVLFFNFGKCQKCAVCYHAFRSVKLTKPGSLLNLAVISQWFFLKLNSCNCGQGKPFLIWSNHCKRICMFWGKIVRKCLSIFHLFNFQDHEYNPRDKKPNKGTFNIFSYFFMLSEQILRKTIGSIENLKFVGSYGSQGFCTTHPISKNEVFVLVRLSKKDLNHFKEQPLLIFHQR